MVTLNEVTSLILKRSEFRSPPSPGPFRAADFSCHLGANPGGPRAGSARGPLRHPRASDSSYVSPRTVSPRPRATHPDPASPWWHFTGTPNPWRTRGAHVARGRPEPRASAALPNQGPPRNSNPALGSQNLLNSSGKVPDWPKNRNRNRPTPTATNTTTVLRRSRERRDPNLAGWASRVKGVGGGGERGGPRRAWGGPGAWQLCGIRETRGFLHPARMHTLPVPLLGYLPYRFSLGGANSNPASPAF